MISTSRTKKIKLTNLFILSIFTLAFLPMLVKAQAALTLSVSPTLFDMSALPGQEWPSTLRVINSNPYDIKVYANVVNFAPQGEGGQGRFIPIINNENQGATMAEWFDINNEEILIPAEKTIEIPFTIKVPHDASPGGHFAAILIGTKPPQDADDSTQVQTSQIVTTLVFLRVAGDINESGSIRSFRTTKSILEKPEATFELRFENKGNVHILPQGEIRILNMWGEERGLIPINRDTLFGNVLPDSIRKYNFTWKGEWSLADIGRYTAIATLAYGDNQRQFSDSETAFWVIPWKILGTVIIVLLSFGYLFVWAIKAYVRKMLSMAGVDTSVSYAKVYNKPIVKKATPITKKKRISTLVAPIEAGMLDLRGRLENSDSFVDRIKALTQFIGNYRVFFIVVLSFLFFVVIVFIYIKSASVNERPYEVIIEGQSSEVKISSEELKYQELESQEDRTDVVADINLPKLTVVNRSGFSGLAAKVRLYLEEKGYEVVDIANDFGVDESRTVIVYPPELSAEALELSKLLDNALLSSYTGKSETKTEITVYAGKDMLNAI